MEIQASHWNPTIHNHKFHTVIKLSTLKYLNPGWNLMIYTALLRSTLQSQDQQYNPKIYTFTKGSKMEYQNPDWNIGIHTVTPRAPLES